MSKSFRYDPRSGEERPDKYSRSERIASKKKKGIAPRDLFPDELDFPKEQDDYRDDARYSPDSLRG